MMEGSYKAGNRRRNQAQLRSSNPYRQTSTMPQDTGVANNYNNYFGQPQSTWYGTHGTQPNPESSFNPESWGWTTEAQHNQGQYFQEAYHTGGHQNYPQQLPQQQSTYQGYDHQNQTSAEVPSQQGQMQWHGMYQGNQGEHINNMSYQQYEQTQSANVDNGNQSNVGKISGNGTGDPWNWGIEDAQPNAGDWGGNEEAWDWTIPGADTPTSVPTPAETPAPLPQRQPQDGAEEACQSLLESSVDTKHVSQPPQTNQLSSDERKTACVMPNVHPSQEMPKVEEANSTQTQNEPIMIIEAEASWGGWIDDSPVLEPVVKREEVKEESLEKSEDGPMMNTEDQSKAPEPVVEQDDIPGEITEQPSETQAPESSVQQSDESTQSSKIGPNHQQPGTIPNMTESAGQQEPSNRSELIQSEILQEFTLEQHTDANHNELLLLQVNQQLREETQSYDQWWQTPDWSLQVQGNLEGTQQQNLVVESESMQHAMDSDQMQPVEPKQGSPERREVQPSHPQDMQWSQQLEGNNLSQLTEDLASFSISSKREMGEGTPAEEEPVPNAISQDDHSMASVKEQHHSKALPEDGANLETLPDNKERLDDEEPANRYPQHSEREAAVNWPQRITQPENQEVAPPKVEVVPSSNSSFVQWQPGVRQRTPEEGGQESRSVAQQRSLGMTTRKGAPSPRPTIGLSSRSSLMLGARDENRAPRPKYHQSRASPSPSNVSQQQSTIGSMPISQQRPQPIRRSNDDTPLPSDRNQYLETGQLRDEEEDEEDEDPCGPPLNQRPPPGLRRMVPGESSSPEAGGASASSLPVADPDGMVDDDDDDALDAVAIPSGPRVVPGVAEGEEENTRNDGVGQVPENSLSSSANLSAGTGQTVAEVPNAERSETIGSEGGTLPSMMPTHSRDSVEDRRGSYSRVDVRRDVSSERERSVAHPKSQPSRGGDSAGVPHIVGGESGEEDRDESKESERGKGHHSRRSGRGMRGKEREDGELSDDDDVDDVSGRRSVEDRHGESEKSRSRRRDHGKGYGSKKVDEVDSSDDRHDDRGGRDDVRRDEKRRRDRGYDDQWSQRHGRRGYNPDADVDDDYYRNQPRRRGSNEWDSHRQHSIPPEERGHHDDRGGSRHDYPSQDWSRDYRHRDWAPEDEYSRDYYNHRHPSSVGGRPPQPYYREGPRSRTNSQLDLGGNGYEGRPGSRGGEGYYSDRDAGWDRRNRGPERGGARMRRESGERESGDWHEREQRTPKSHYLHPYHSHHLRPEPPFYGVDLRYAPESRQFSPYSPGYDYYGHPLHPSQLPHPYFNDPYRLQRDPYGHAYLYLEEMRRSRPHEYAEWYQKNYGRSTGPLPNVGGGPETPVRRTPSASGGGASPVGHTRSDAGGEGGHSLEDTPLGDDSRGSVHSGRSSLNLLQPNTDDESTSGQKLGADRSLSSPYRGTEQISSQESTPQRLTPAKFPSAHIKAVLTGHGSLLVLKPNILLDHPSSTVEFLSLRELLKNDPTMAELEGFPGPLIGGTTHKNSVIQFCNSKINAAANDMDIHDRESYILLWKLLILLLKQNGSVVGTDISSLLLEDSAYLHNPTCDSVPGSVSPQLIPEELSSNSNLTTPDEGIVAGGSLPTQILGSRVPQFSEEYLTKKFREYLLFGNTKDALEWAMKHGLWGHAMFLAHKIGGRMLASVLTRFANNLPHNDPLQTLYQLLSGKQPAAITSCSDEKWGDWRPHLAMIISNSSSHPDLQRKSIITLGDTLAARGCLYASQFCYVISTLNMGSSTGTPSSSIHEMNALFSGPDARPILLGSAVPLTRNSECKIPNEVVHCTEVLEYARCLADPNYCIPYFQPIKFEYAIRLVEHGMIQEGLQYFEAVATKVTSWMTLGGVDQSIDLHFLKCVSKISDQLKHQDPVLERNESGGVIDPNWLQELNKCIKIVEGQPDGMTAGIQQINAMGSVYGTQAATEGQTSYGVMSTDGVTGAQTDVSGQGVIPSADYKAQWNNFYYEQAKWQQQQQQQQMTQPSQSETTGGSAEMVAPSAVDSSHITSSFSGYVWDPMNRSSVGNTMVTDSVNVSGEVQEDMHHQTPPTASVTQDSNTARIGNTGQLSSEPVSESGTNSYWDIATSNDQTVSCLSGEEEEEDNDDDEEDEEESEEEEEDYEDEHPHKDVTGRQRQLSESNSSVRNWRVVESSQKGRKEAPEGKGSGTNVSGTGASGGGWLGGLLSKFSLRPKNQMNLPDDKNPSIVWDNEKKQWVNMDADEDETVADLKPPPKASELIPTITQSSAAMNSLPQSGNLVGNSVPENNAPMPAVSGFGNMYKLPKGRKMRQNYVDVMGNSTTKPASRGTMPPPLDLFPQPAAPSTAGSFFIPAPVHDDSAPTDFLTSASTAENEVQESSENIMYQERKQYLLQSNVHYQ